MLSRSTLARGLAATAATAANTARVTTATAADATYLLPGPAWHSVPATASHACPSQLRLQGLHQGHLDCLLGYLVCCRGARLPALAICSALAARAGPSATSPRCRATSSRHQRSKICVYPLRHDTLRQRTPAPWSLHTEPASHACAQQADIGACSCTRSFWLVAAEQLNDNPW